MLYRIDTSYCPEVLRPDPVYPAEEWIEADSNEILCKICKYIDRNQYPRPCHIVLDDQPQDQAMALVETTGIRIFRRDFIEAFRPYLTGFIIGDCYLLDGTRINDYVTCYHQTFIVPRGNHQSRYSKCPRCGIIVSRLGNAPQYILYRYLKGGSIYQDASCSLYIAEQILEKIDISQWDNVHLDALPIREQPVDGQYVDDDS